MDQPQPVIADRARVFALIDAAPATGTLLVPSVSSAAPIARLPARLEAKLAGRTAVGLDVQGQDYPSRHLWPRTIAGATAAASLDVIVLLIAWLFDSDLWMILSGAVLAALLATIVVAVAVTRRDPYRLSRPERRALHQAGHWRSRQPWDGRLSARPEYRLVAAAAGAAARVANARAWTSGYLDEHRVRLDLAAELDRVDEQAYQLAAARAGIAQAPSNGSELRRHDDALAPVWLAAVDRVGALLRYADHVQALDGQLGELAAIDRADRQVGQLVAGAVQDEFETEQLRQLSGELGYLQVAIRDTTVLLQSDARAIAMGSS